MSGQCTTTLKRLLLQCGYEYRHHTQYRTILDRVRQAIKKLQYMGCIENVYDASTGECQDIETLPPSLAFEMEVNPLIISDTSHGYLIVYLDDYLKIYNSVQPSTSIKIYKILKLYCYLGIRIFQYPDRTVEEAVAKPEYHRTTLVDLYEALGKGFHQSATTEMIMQLHCNNLIHYEAARPIKAPTGEVRQVGLVFVRHSNYWDIELRAAVEAARNHRRQYYVAS
jgi:hypothetical protein